MTTVRDMMWIPVSSSVEKPTSLLSIESERDDITALWTNPAEIKNEIQYLIQLGRMEIFEAGFDNRFSHHLSYLIDEYGNSAIALLSEMINQDRSNISPSIAGEILKLLGEVSNTHLKSWVFSALVKGLSSEYVDVKDGAILGLAALDDPKAILHLETAIAHEKNAELREDMKQVLEQLIQTREEHG